MNINNRIKERVERGKYPVREITDLRDLLDSSADMFGDVTAYLHKLKLGGSFVPITYRQTKEDVDSLGTALLDEGFKGKRIAVIGENRYEWLVSYLAVANGLGIVIPLDRELPPSEIAALITRAEIDAVIYSAKVEQKVVDAVNSLGSTVKLISMDSPESTARVLSLKALFIKGRKLLDSGNRLFSQLPIDPDEMRILLFTSGTTGLAKGVMLCHRNICSNIYNMSQYVDLSKRQGQQIGLSILPMHHTYEFSCNILAPFYQGATIAFCEGLKYIVKNLAEAKVTYMLAVPLIFESMHQKIWKQSEKNGKADKMRMAIKMVRALSHIDKKVEKKTAKLFKEVHEALGGHVRLMIAGAAAIDPAVINNFNAMGITMLQGYGMTECSPIIALNPDYALKAAAAGLPLPHTEVFIDDADENGIGEIVCKSDSVMLGYYKDEEETAKVLKDGWLHTGDYGYIDRDGYVYITGRKKNVIVTKNGKNIFPEEVEFYMNKSPFISEIVVKGIEDEKTGDLVVFAEIFPDMAAIEEVKGPVDAAAIHDILKPEVDKYNDMMPLYKRVKRFAIRDTEFEKTTTKKIKRW